MRCKFSNHVFFDLPHPVNMCAIMIMGIDMPRLHISNSTTVKVLHRAETKKYDSRYLVSETALKSGFERRPISMNKDFIL